MEDFILDSVYSLLISVKSESEDTYNPDEEVISDSQTPNLCEYSNSEQ